MRWSKIKNIIILLLAVVNLCLLVITFSRSWRARQGELELRERMVEVLEQNGIQYLPDEVPGEMPLAGARVSIAAPGKETAGALVGQVAQTQTAWARTTYTGERGKVTFSDDGGVEAAFEPGAWPMSQDDWEAPEEWGKAVLEGLGITVKAKDAQALGISQPSQVCV